MKIGEKVTIERVPSGLYKIEQNGAPTYIGAAASTAMTLMRTVFYHEACEVPKKS